MSKGALRNVNAGYRGILELGSTPLRVRFSDATVTAKQVIEAPDLVMGDWDRNAYVYGKVEVGGSISGPVTEKFLSSNSIFEWGCGRDTSECGALTANDVKLYYYCNKSRLFEDMYVNSLNFSVSAGDVAQFSIDVVGAKVGDDGGWGEDTPYHFTEPEKLITWDKINLTITDPGETDNSSSSESSDSPSSVIFSNFDFTVSNNVETVYGLGQNNLLPFDIVPGLRHISGTLSAFNAPGYDGADQFEDYCTGNEWTLTLDISSDCASVGSTVAMKVRFHRVEPTLNTGVIMSTVGFTGVTHQTGFPWDV
jgi:hypothetical protein